MSVWRSVAAGLLVATVVGGFGVPAAASHDVDDRLYVAIAINAAGGDRLGVSGDQSDPSVPTDFVALADEVAIALDRRPGTFRATEDFDGAAVVLDEKLAVPDSRGGLTYALDTGALQVLAQRAGFDAVVVGVCTPRMRQVFDALVAPQSLGGLLPGSRCGGWYQPVDEPPIRADVQLDPDRQRFPRAVRRTVGIAAMSFAVLGLGATLLRRGPLRRRSLASWLVSAAALVAVAPIGYIAVSLVLWWTGAPNDSMVLGCRDVSDQVIRTLLPGLAFVVPALLPAVILLSAPRREKPPPPAPSVPLDPSAPQWWPAEWWSQWAAQGRR